MRYSLNDYYKRFFSLQRELKTASRELDAVDDGDKSVVRHILPTSSKRNVKKLVEREKIYVDIRTNAGPGCSKAG